MNADLASALQTTLDRLLPQKLTGRATLWLVTHTGWLLILDDVDNPDRIALLLAHAANGRSLMASRRSPGWPVSAVTVALGRPHLARVPRPPQGEGLSGQVR